MRRSVQEAIRQVRKSIASDKLWNIPPSPALWAAETLADEVERLHKRIEALELQAADNAISEAGGDPEEVGKRGAAFVAGLVERRSAKH